MATSESTPAWLSADVAAAAALVAPAENRSVTEQVIYWARIGMQIERWISLEKSTSPRGHRGEGEFSTLGPEERVVAHATIDARMAERLAGDGFGPAARRTGHVTVAIPDDGNVIEIAPEPRCSIAGRSSSEP